ncbi:cytochrome P450 family protein [Myceligenerans salitolerans]|uniref:Cytochrome P450 n=1 Tax=Myceligenerans salitolerans TaxID=1230528 RepID=A0ABS3IBA7_9MICO|nr:cytochrome P450 [Myceligenerans salitolerans]MBO0609901.1 cytochrome P450 [Myceligenerans salitolerans]
MTPSPALTLDPTGGDIHGEIERVRAQGPLVQVALPGGLAAWMATDYAVITSLLTDQRVSKDAAQHWADLRAGNVPPDWPLMPWIAKSGMFTAHGREHRRLRRLAGGAFTQHRVNALKPMIQDIVTGTLDDVACRLDQPGSPTADLRETFCFPIPIETIGALLGVPDDLLAPIRSGADALFDTAITPDQLAERFGDLNMAVAELITRRRHKPTSDLTSALIRATHDGAGYSDDELIETVRVLVVAGYETTVNLLDQAAVALLAHPEHLVAAREGCISWEDVIDETLRWRSPAANLPLRYATEDIVIDGLTIAAGEAILTSFAGAGRDPQVHENSHVFDPTRTTRQDHLGFGHGAHRCLGAPLAVLEAAIALPALFDRFPNLTLAEPAADLLANPGFITDGHARVPVRLG